MTPFTDRTEAGRRLADRLHEMDLDAPAVLALPRGGITVAEPVARALDAPLDVLLVRKLGAPTNPEFGVGAVAEEGVLVLDDDVLGRLGLDRDDLARQIEGERQELARRHQRYRGGRARVPVEGRTAVVVDDGLATGVTAAAAGRALRELGAARTVLALPVASREGLARVGPHYDDVVVLETPAHFMAVGNWYRDFAQVSDDTVVAVLERTAR